MKISRFRSIVLELKRRLSSHHRVSLPGKRRAGFKAEISGNLKEKIVFRGIINDEREREKAAC